MTIRRNVIPIKNRSARATCDEADPIVPNRTSRREPGSGRFDRNFGCHHPDFRLSGNEQRMRSPSSNEALEHDPEKWQPVFRKDHAQTKG
jgi:hypothetical protein